MRRAAPPSHPDRDWPDYLGRLQVSVEFAAAGLSPKSGTLMFYFTGSERLPAEFTGEFEDWLHEGDLVVGVGLEVEHAGRYRVEANLYSLGGEPVAWARFEEHLERGEQQANLLFDGLIFRDAGVRPPYVVGEVRGARLRPGDAPHREELASLDGRHRLENHYVLEDFRASREMDARTREMVMRYEDALARGVRLTRPRD